MTEKLCAECGIEFAGQATDGLCPKCLLGLGLDLAGGHHFRVRCPHCHNPIEVVDEPPVDEITCPSCDSRFHLIEDETRTFTRSQSPKKIGQFELVDCVGTGGFGSVWKARDTELDRFVAIKIPRNAQVSAEEKEQFFREARAAAQLRHPNIVRVHEIGKSDDQFYIVSDFVDGITLADLLSAETMSAKESAEMCCTIAEALDHAHRQGVIHRDIKPSNILLEKSKPQDLVVSGFDSANQPNRKQLPVGKRLWVPHVTDFGLARRDSGEMTITVDGRILGTPAYMSPEQASGKGHMADARSDVYSLGAVLFEMLTCEKPFRGTSRMLLHQVIHEDAPRPRKLNPGVPVDMETICLKCLEKEPSQRYESMRSLAADLRRYLNGEPVYARPITSLHRAWRWSKRNPVISSLVAALLLALTVGITATSWQWYRAEISRLGEKEQHEKADQSAFQSNQQLVNSFVKEGNRLADLDDPFLALPYYLHALKIDANPDRHRFHQRRLNSLLAGIPYLEHVWQFESAILDAEFSPDGQLLALAQANGTVNIINIMGRSIVHTLQHKNSVLELRFQQQGKTLLCFSGRSSRASNLDFWDVTTGLRRTRTFEAARDDNPSSGRTFGDAVLLDDNQLYTLEWSEGRDHYRWVLNHFMIDKPDELPTEILAETAIYDAPFLTSSGDQKVLALVSGKCWLVDTAQQKLADLVIETGWRPKAHLNNDGSKLVQASRTALTLWDTKTGNRIGSIKSPNSESSWLDVKFMEHDQFLSGIDDDGILYEIDMTTSKVSSRSQDTTGQIDQSWLSPDFGRMAFRSRTDDQDSFFQSQGIRIWNPYSRTASAYRIYHHGPIRKVAFHPHNSLMVTCGKDGIAKLWNLATQPKTLPELDHPLWWLLDDVELIESSTNRIFAAFRGLGYEELSDKLPIIEDLRKSSEMDIYDQAVLKIDERFKRLFPDLAKAGKFLILPEYDQSRTGAQATIKLSCSDPSTNKLLWSWQTDVQPFSTSQDDRFKIASSVNESLIALGVVLTRQTDDKDIVDYETTSQIFLFNTTGNQLGAPIDLEGELIDLSFDSTGHRLLCSHNSFDVNVGRPVGKARKSVVQVWDLKSRRPLFPPIRRNYFSRVYFSNNRLVFAIAGETGELSLHNAANGQAVISPIRLPSQLDELVFSSDDSLFAARCSTNGPRGGFAQGWEADTGRAVTMRIPSDRFGKIHFASNDQALLVRNNELFEFWPISSAPLKTRTEILCRLLSLHEIDEYGSLSELDSGTISQSYSKIRNTEFANVPSDDSDRQWHIHDALECMKTNRWRLAISKLENLASEQPRSWLWKWYLAQCYRELDPDDQRVMSFLNQSLELTENNALVWHSLAEQFVRDKDWDQAAEAFAKLNSASISEQARYFEVLARAMGTDAGAFQNSRKDLLASELESNFVDPGFPSVGNEFDKSLTLIELSLLSTWDMSQTNMLFSGIEKRFLGIGRDLGIIHKTLLGDRATLALTNYLLARVRLNQNVDEVVEILKRLANESNDSKMHYLLAIAQISSDQDEDARKSFLAGKQRQSEFDENKTWQEVAIDRLLVQEIENALAGDE